MGQRIRTKLVCLADKGALSPEDQAKLEALGYTVVYNQMPGQAIQISTVTIEEFDA